ncbi:cysteine peptidase family C39 domain-containing protein, partial [Acinetobacter baumannii]
ELGLGNAPASAEQIVRAARRIGLKSTLSKRQALNRLTTAPMPAIVGMADGSFEVLTHRTTDGKLRLVNPLTRAQSIVTLEEIKTRWSGTIVL